VTSIEVLRDEYPGDIAWGRYTQAVCKGLGAPRLFATPQEVDVETAGVVVALLGERASEWWLSPIRALDNFSPSEVFSGVPNGRQVVRSLLMRLP
jgi:hypothetical protein